MWVLGLLVAAALALTVGTIVYTSLAIVNAEGRRKNIQLAAALGALLVVAVLLSAFVRGRGRAQDLAVDGYWRDAFLPRARAGDRQALDTLLSL